MGHPIWKVAEAKARLAQVLRAASKEPQEITRRGRTVAVIVNAEDYHALADSRNTYTLADLLAVSEEVRQSGAQLNLPRPHHPR